MQQILFVAGILSIIFGVYAFIKIQNKKGLLALIIGLSLIGFAYLRVFLTNEEKHTVQTENYIKIIGSKTIGQYLMPELVKLYMETKGYKVFKQNEMAEKLVISGSKQEEDKKDIIHFEIIITGSVKGYEYLKNGESQISMSSTQMPDEIAQSMGNDFSKKNNKNIIGYDAIRIIAHPSKSKFLKALDFKTFEKIIQGEIKNWDQLVKAQKGDINICLRDINSGTFKFIEEKFLSHHIPDSLHIPAKFEHLDYFEKIAKKVSEDSLSIGLVDFGIDSLVIKDVYTLGIKINEEQITYPELNSIADFSYPLSRPLILYTKGDISKNELLSDFIKFCTGDSVRQKIEEIGFVPK